MARPVRLLPWLAAALILAFAAGPAPARTLADQIETLAEEEGLEVEGLDLLDEAPETPAAGATVERIRALLAGFNYVLLYDSAGRPSRLRITGRKGPRPVVAPRDTVETRRRGPHHLVDAAVTGPNGRPATVTLIVDTGATTVVLPASLIAALGFRPEELSDGWAQTANGRVAVKLATLPRLALGPLRVRDVAVSFIADERLAGQALLGMSFLERFRFTLDDEADHLILKAR